MQQALNVLLLNQFFAPDPAPTGHLAADLARHLAADGHNVTVVCSRTTYAAAGGSATDPLPVRIHVHRVAGRHFSRAVLGRLLSGHLAACHIGLATQNPATLGCVVPSKTYALMASAPPSSSSGPAMPPPPSTSSASARSR